MKRLASITPWLAAALVAWPGATMADGDREEDLRLCLVEALEAADDADTVGMLREKCQVKVAGQELAKVTVPNLRLIERRVQLEKEASANRFAIIQHKGSYILPLSYNSDPNDAPFADAGDDIELDNVETKFQFSIKAQLFDDILRDRGRLFFGYTNQSYWQILNTDNSGPFRETNHEPEVFVDMDHDFHWGGWHVPLIRAGLVHQSNGRSEPLSRSWNRLYAQVFLEKENWAISFKPWVRVNGDSAETDNPDIDDYMGNFELGIFRQGKQNSASLRLRNNLRSENRGSVELNWARPLPFDRKVHIILQYFNGYGESLIDYNVKTERFGIGLQLSDFL